MWLNGLDRPRKQGTTTAGLIDPGFSSDLTQIPTPDLPAKRRKPPGFASARQYIHRRCVRQTTDRASRRPKLVYGQEWFDGLSLSREGTLDRRLYFEHLLRRGIGADRAAAAGGHREPRGQSSSHGDRRFRRPRGGDRQGRRRRPRRGLHRAAQLHRRPAGQDRRPALSNRAGHLQGGRRSAERQSRQGQSHGGQRQPAAAARPGAGQKPERAASHRRSTRSHRAGGAGRRVAGPGAARAGKDQSRLHRDPLADRRPDRPCQFHHRQSRRSVVRNGWRRSSARIRSMSPSRRAKPISSNTGTAWPRSADKSPHVTIHIKLPNGTIYPHAGADQLPRRPGRGRYRHRRGAGATAESRWLVDTGRHRRRHRRTRRAARVAGRRPIRRAARPGRALRHGGRRREKGRAAARHHRQRARPRRRRDRRAEGRRARHRRGRFRKSIPDKSWRRPSRREIERRCFPAFSSTGRDSPSSSPS